jgi:hypothetical protein
MTLFETIIQTNTPGEFFFDFLTDINTTTKFSIDALIKELLYFSKLMAGCIALIYISYKVIVAFIKPNQPIDPQTLVRPCLILAALVLYQPLISLLIDAPEEFLIDIVNESLNNVGGVIGANKSERLANANSALTSVQDTDSSGGDGIYDLLSIFPIMEMLHFIVYIASSLIIFYMILKQFVLKSIYYALGVFVLTFSLIPSNESSLSKWFLGYLSVILWIPIMDILLGLINLTQSSINAFTIGGAVFTYSFPIITLAVQIFYIFAILKVPTYANIIVGGSGSPAGAQLKTLKSLATSKMSGGSKGKKQEE